MLKDTEIYTKIDVEDIKAVFDSQASEDARMSGNALDSRSEANSSEASLVEAGFRKNTIRWKKAYPQGPHGLSAASA